MALREVLAKFGFEVDSSKLDEAKSKTDQFVGTLQKLAFAGLGAKVLGGLKNFVGGLQDTASELSRTSKAVSMSTREVQQWGLAGVGAESLGTSVRHMQQAIAGGGAEFTKLGVKMKDSSGQTRSTSDLLLDVGTAIAGIKDPSQRTAAAMKTFGRGGNELIAPFSKGKDAINQLRGSIDELGGGLSETAIAKIKESGRETKRFDFALMGLKSTFAIELLPQLTALMKHAVAAVVSFKKMTEGTQIFRAALIVLGTVAVVQALKMYAAYLPMIAALGLLIAVVDDLTVAFRGGDSLIGRVLDRILGKGAGQSIFKQINRDWAGLVNAVEAKQGLFSKVGEVFSQVGGSIVRFFADDIPDLWDMFWQKANQSLGFASGDFGSAVERAFGVAGAAIIGWGVGLWASLEELFSQGGAAIVTAVVDIGSAIAKGIADGITAGEQWIIDAITGIGGSIKDTFKSIFKINSPSKIMFEMGDFLSQGLADGIVSGGPMVSAAAGSAFTIPAPKVSTSTNTSTNSNAISQNNRIEITVNGGGSDTVSAVRSGVLSGLNDDRQALLDALEATA